MVRFIILVAILILALSFFGISIRAIVESPTGHDNFAFIWNIILNGWHVIRAWFELFVSTVQAVIPG